MTQSRCIIDILIVCFAFQTSPVHANAKIDRLDTSLRAIDESSRAERHVLGSGLLMLATASGVAAVFANQSSDPGLKSQGPMLFGVAGGVFALAGTVVLLHVRQSETLPEGFRKMPERSTAEVHSKVKYGEMALSTLARRASLERQWVAGTATGIGGALLAWYAINSQVAGGSLVYVGGFFLFLGVAGFTSESTAEMELMNYRSGGSSSVSWGIAPLPGGGMVQTALRF